MLHDPILAYADSVERRVGMAGIMNACACSVLAALEAQLDTIQHGTPLRPAGGVPCTSHDRREMHRFLQGFVGHGVVCSIMDKADHTLTWQCPHDYCRRLVKDLTSNGVYQVSTEDTTTVMARHTAFLTSQGMTIDPNCQAIPYYVGCPTMHKDPVDMRFISSSASSSMKCISVWINRALNGMQQEVDMLLADNMKSIGITAPWAARSWILKNAGDMLSLKIHSVLMPHQDTLTYKPGTFSAYTLTFS